MIEIILKYLQTLDVKLCLCRVAWESGKSGLIDGMFTFPVREARMGLEVQILLRACRLFQRTFGCDGEYVFRISSTKTPGRTLGTTMEIFRP